MGERISPEEAVRKLHAERFPDARCLLLAGSFVRGDATATSDLDVVVLYEQLAHASRASLMFEGYPVEVFVHDPQTLRAFQLDDIACGRPCMTQMVREGIPIPASSPWIEAIKREADAQFERGPEPLSTEQIDSHRYGISDLLEDLAGAQDDRERVAIGAKLYEQLAEFFFRSQRRWSAAGKWIPRLMAEEGRVGADFLAAFDALFRDDDPEPLLAWTHALLAPHGGPLFAGYQRDAPADMRVDSDPRSKVQTAIRRASQALDPAQVRDMFQRGRSFGLVALSGDRSADVVALLEDAGYQVRDSTSVSAPFDQLRDALEWRRGDATVKKAYFVAGGWTVLLDPELAFVSWTELLTDYAEDGRVVAAVWERVSQTVFLQELDATGVLRHTHYVQGQPQEDRGEEPHPEIVQDAGEMGLLRALANRLEIGAVFGDVEARVLELELVD